MKQLKEHALEWRNRTTIQKQLSLIVALAVTLAMALLIMFNYFSQARTNADRQVSMLRRVLVLESRNLDKYISELRSFSLQLRNHFPFMELISKTAPLDYSQRQIVESALKLSFFSRSDVVKMELYLVRQEVTYTLDRISRKMAVTMNSDIADLPDYKVFTNKPDFCSIAPSEDGFLQITRTIIDSPRETPLAVVRFTVDVDMAMNLALSHGQENEQLCILGTDGKYYFLPESLTQREAVALRQLAANGAENQTIRLGGQDMLCVATSAEQYGFILVGFKPMALVNAPLIATRNGSIVLGLVTLALTVLLVLYCIRFVTTPLSKLAHRLRRVGTGNFTTKAVLEGSAEFIGLSEDVNEMMAGIHRLIEGHYVAQLNERTAQLIALEAQTNPHFLFNTLQAISTQAIVQKHDDIYRMITALASLLRYSIKGGNLAPLQTELDHVEKYLSLQKARFGDGLSYDLLVDSCLLSFAIPKLGVLSLVENSITHGLNGDTTAVHIQLEAKIAYHAAIFCVRDNGCGIPPDKLGELRAALHTPSVRITKNIGLMNLASRLRLLYDGKARLEIESVTEVPHQTIVTITIPLEVLQSAQDLAD